MMRVETRSGFDILEGHLSYCSATILDFGNIIRQIHFVSNYSIPPPQNNSTVLPHHDENLSYRHP